jgi:hypothetical protein
MKKRKAMGVLKQERAETLAQRHAVSLQQFYIDLGRWTTVSESVLDYLAGIRDQAIELAEALKK